MWLACDLCPETDVFTIRFQDLTNTRFSSIGSSCVNEKQKGHIDHLKDSEHVHHNSIKESPSET